MNNWLIIIAAVILMLSLPLLLTTTRAAAVDNANTNTTVYNNTNATMYNVMSKVMGQNTLFIKRFSSITEQCNTLVDERNTTGLQHCLKLYLNLNKHFKTILNENRLDIDEIMQGG